MNINCSCLSLKDLVSIRQTLSQLKELNNNCKPNSDLHFIKKKEHIIYPSYMMISE